MAVIYRVVDLRTRTDEPLEIMVGDARSPENAAHIALGEDLSRGGHSRNLRARVYFQNPGSSLTMVRLYSKAIPHD